jgi:hypothetical protein
MATANVLTAATTLQCSHGAPVSKTSDAKLTVSGSAVLLDSQVASWSIATCTQTGSSQTPCTKVETPTAGATDKLKVGTSKVLLDSLEATTNGKPINTLKKPTGTAKLQVG